MYDDEDSKRRRCDTCKFEEDRQPKCRNCGNNHIVFIDGKRLPYWRPKENKEDESTD